MRIYCNCKTEKKHFNHNPKKIHRFTIKLKLLNIVSMSSRSHPSLDRVTVCCAVLEMTHFLSFSLQNKIFSNKSKPGNKLKVGTAQAVTASFNINNRK